MAHYFKIGKIPPTRHTIFKKDDGGYYYEQLFGTEGFHGLSSLLYHCQRPTQIKSVLPPVSLIPEIAIEKNLMPLKLHGFEIPPADDYLDSRIPLLVNTDV